MTLGERIGSLRKEKGLSQEALGELVGVSRQAVSKWESDKAVPDVNNCVSMSKVFGVSLAQLLDLEDAQSQPSEELSEQQLRLVEKMITQYSTAQKKLRNRWRWPFVLALCALLVCAAWLWEWLNDMNRTIDYLSGELSGMRGEIVSGVGDRFEESLEEDRSLVTRFTAERVSADVSENTVTFDVSVTLKEGTEWTHVQFASRHGDQVVVSEARNIGGLSYAARVTCPIMDEPTIDLLVERDGVTQSQTFTAECYESDYAIRLSGDARWAALQQSGLSDGAVEPVAVYAFLDPGYGLEEPLALTALEIGIFRNDALIGTFPMDLTLGYYGALRDWNFTCEYDIPLTADMAQPGDTLTFVLLAQDNYGRKASAILSRYGVLERGQMEVLSSEEISLDDGTYGTEGWK